VLAVSGAAAAVVAAGRRFMPELAPATLDARWRAVIEVCVWSVPYVAVLGVGMWKFALDESDRQRMRELLTRQVRRAHG
jgi:hypothetical protein